MHVGSILVTLALIISADMDQMALRVCWMCLLAVGAWANDLRTARLLLQWESPELFSVLAPWCHYGMGAPVTYRESCSPKLSILAPPSCSQCPEGIPGYALQPTLAVLAALHRKGLG